MISSRLDNNDDDKHEEEEEEEEEDEEEEEEEEEDPPGSVSVRRKRTVCAYAWRCYVSVRSAGDTPWKRWCFTYMLIGRQRYSL